MKNELNGHAERPAIIRRAEDEVVAAVKAALKTQDRSSWAIADGYAELARQGWTQHRIAQEFSVNQGTVSRYLACVRLYAVAHSRPTFWRAYEQVTNRPEVEEKPSETFNAAQWLAQHNIAQGPRPGDPDFEPNDLPALTPEELERLEQIAGPLPDTLGELAEEARQLVIDLRLADSGK